MAAPYEQDIILDAEGKPLFAALDRVQKQVERINRDVVKTAQELGVTLNNMGTMLETQAKTASQRMSQISSLARANNFAGLNIQDTDQRRKLGQLTTSVTEYARGIESTSSSVEALTTRMNRLNDAVAARGRLGYGETLAQTKQRKALQDQRRDVEELEKALGKLQSRAGRTSVGPGDRLGAQSAAGRVAGARDALFMATRDPNRDSFKPEIARLRSATDAFDNFYADLRGKQAARLTDERATARTLERLDVSSQNNRVAQEDRMWAARERRHSTAVKRSNDIDKAFASDETRRLSEREKQMDSMWSRREKVAKERASGKLLPGEELGLQEASRMNFGGLSGDQSRSLRTQQNRAELDDMKAAGVARAKEMSDMAAINMARTQSVAKLNELRVARRLANNPADHEYLTRQIKGEQAYMAALRARVVELNRAAAAEARQSAGGGGPASSVGRILSPGYMGAAALRTGVYGAAAMGVYALFNTIQGGLTYVVQMEDELAKLAAIANATPAQMGQLSAAITTIGSETRFANVELVKISQTLAQAGVSASEMEGVLRSVTTLATASGSTPDEAVQLVTSALGSFQLQGSEAARVADLMTNALNRTKLTVQQTGQAIQYVGATAFEQNISLEQMLATVGAIAQAGVRSGSTIGTGFRQFLVDLQQPSEKLTEQLSLLGLSASDMDVTVRGLPAVLDTLRDAGFGAGQAYAGLELRAAAFYLTAKNNVDVMDNLMLSFAQTDAAAKANERAMDSLSAQWTRFKNIIGENFATAAQPVLDTLKAMIKGLNDAMNEADQRAKGGWQGYLDRNGGSQVGASLEYIGDGSALKDAFAESQWEKDYTAWIWGVEKATAASKDYTTAINETSQATESQSSKLGEIEKEYQRLLVQKESLINNDTRSQAEMVSLMSRFEGLSGYLTNTKNNYVDLTNAVRGYISAQAGVLTGDIATQQAVMANQSATLGSRSQSLRTQIRGDGAYGKLTGAERGALDSLSTYGAGTSEFNRAQAVIADAAKRVGIVGTNLGGLLTRLAGTLGDRNANAGSQRVLNMQRQTLAGQGTVEGNKVYTDLKAAEALITRAQGATGAEQQRLVSEGTKILDARIKMLETFRSKKEYQPYFTGALQDARSLQAQFKAIVTPTAAEAKAAAAEAKAAAREAKADKMTAFGSPMAGGISSGMGQRWGRDHKGVDIKAAVGTAVMAAADGIVKKRDHEAGGYGNYLVLDHGGGTESRYAHLSGMDVVEGQAVTKGQKIGASGGAKGVPGSGNSRGPHLHYEVRRGGKPVNPFGSHPTNEDAYGDAEKYAEQAERERERFQKSFDAREVKLAEKALTLRIEEMAKTTSTAAFSAAAEQAEANLAYLEAALRKQAENELNASGISPSDPEYQDRLDQLEADIKQRGQDYRQKVIDGIFANVQNAFSAAELATREVLARYDRIVNMAQARVSGMDYASLEGRVPEYMKQLAQRRVAQGEESRDRARLGALPAEIGSKESALGDAERELALIRAAGGAYEEQEQKVRDLTLAIQALRDEKDTLFTALNVGEELPRTLAEGLDRAIEAYREYNNLNRTLQEEIIFNMGGVLTTAHESLNTFFTDIFTGSRSVLGAFGDMVQGMVKYLQQMAAQFVANQVFKVLLNLLGSTVGSAAGLGGNIDGSTIGSQPTFNFGGYRGGKMTSHGIDRFYGGGKIGSGSRSHDSTLALVAKDEWVINRSAADSVGDDFMSDLNKRGAMAVRDAGGGGMNVIQQPKQETNVYVIPPEQRPSLGTNDVLVVMRDDMVNGEGRKLIKQISQGG